MPNPNSDYIYFHEEQRFSKAGWSTALIVGAVITAVAGLLLWLNVGFETSRNQAVIPIFAMVIGILAALSILALVLFSKLQTEVNPNGLYIQYFPFHLSPKRIPLENVVHVETKTYRPIRDYGGYGIRYGRCGKAYNVSGNEGVELQFTAGKNLLIGSQKPEQLALAIKKLMSK